MQASQSGRFASWSYEIKENCSLYCDELPTRGIEHPCEMVNRSRGGKTLNSFNLQTKFENDTAAINLKISYY